ncbi:MAG: VOC family protein [Syntrophaceae bacterium]|nr:VOC family protein [Syntrophaceae bacterium]
MGQEVVVNCIDRISIAVFDVVKAEQDYCRLFGWDVAERYTDHDLQINVSCFAVGPTIVELMEGGDEWYELLDLQGNVVLSGKGDETRWSRKAKPMREREDYEFGVQLLGLNVDSVNDAVNALKSNGVQVLPERTREGREIRYWRSQKKYQAFIHPDDTHGVYWRVIDKLPSPEK